jgi:hypothetical protein
MPEGVMLRIACLHTAESNADLFDAEVRRRADPVRLSHGVRADLLAAVEADGGVTPETARACAAQLAEMAARADAVILTCSSLGEVVDPTCPVIRADAALAASALQAPGRVAVLFTAPTSRGPTERVFHAAAPRGSGLPEVRIVPGAWDAFRSGDAEGHMALIRQAMAEAGQAGFARIALAQCSMAPAGDAQVDGPPVLTIPGAALAAAVASIRR